MERARNEPERFPLFFFDEATLHSQPGPAWQWHPEGRVQPTVRLKAGADRGHRVAALLSVAGDLLFRGYPKITVKRLADLYHLAGDAFPEAEKVTIVLDNWPVHFHPRALKAVEEDPRIELLRLPTYSPWLNPVEKVWRMLRQRLEHHHPFSHDFQALKDRSEDTLKEIAEAREELLRYVGLKPQ